MFRPLPLGQYVLSTREWFGDLWHNPVFIILTVGIYELVRHDIKAGLLSQFEHVAQEGMPARLLYDYPKPMGMWYSEFGPSQRGSRN